MEIPKSYILRPGTAIEKVFKLNIVNEDEK